MKDEMIPKTNWDNRACTIKVVLGRNPVKEKAFLTFIEGVALGRSTRELLKEVHLTWIEFSNLYHLDKTLRALYVRSKELGEVFRQTLREEEADRRGMEGVKKPQFHKGKVCGYVREYSDSMLALQLKAGNPDKYSERKQVEMKGVVLNLTVEGVERSPAPIDIDEELVEGEETPT